MIGGSGGSGADGDTGSKFREKNGVLSMSN